jgi:hypothetical protein
MAVKSVVVLVLCAIAPAGTKAGTADVVNSKVTLEVKRDVRFKGRVKSPASDCAIGRKVLLFHQRSGDDDKIAKTFTSESGKYAVKVPMQRGNRIYALVKRFRTPLDTVCEADRSRAVRV